VRSGWLDYDGKLARSLMTTAGRAAPLSVPLALIFLAIGRIVGRLRLRHRIRTVEKEHP